MTFDLRVRLASGSALATDLVEGTASAARFFVADFRSLEAYRDKLEEVDARFSAFERSEAAGAIRCHHGEARARLDRVVAENGVFVTTGQQPGLFAGPLFSVYKGLTTIALANALEEHLDRPVAPLFWVASEDHDWEEVRWTTLPDLGNDLLTLTVERPENTADFPLSRIPLGASIATRIDAFRDALPPSEFRDGYVGIVRDAYTPGSTMAQGFEETLGPLLGRLGMGFTDAAHPVVKKRSITVLTRSLRESESEEKLLSARARALQDAGYDPQVPILEGGVNLFLDGSRGRERLYRDGDGYRTRQSGAEYTSDQLLEITTSEPGRLSPNVLLRPVVENTVFPSLAYVAGPGEIAYYGQLSELYEFHGMTMPVIHPRHSVIVLESKIGKVLDKFDLRPEELSGPMHEIAGRLARDETPEAVSDAIGALRGAIGQGIPPLQNAAATIDPTLKGPIQSARSSMFEAMKEVEKKIVQSVKRQNEVALEQIEKAKVHLYPNGSPQERVFNPFYYLARYGDSFLEAVLDRCAIEVAEAVADATVERS